MGVHSLPTLSLTSSVSAPEGRLRVTVWLFPDNTVLINFAYLHRMDLLRRLLGHPTWCATVAHECRMSSSEPDLEDLKDAPDLFGEPLFPENPGEHILTTVYRKQLSRPGDAPTKNLGEAETLAIIHSRNIKAVFFTDDAGPAALLAGEPSGMQVQTATTWGLLRTACRVHFVDGDTLWSYVSVLRSKNRHLPPGRAGFDRDEFTAWLES
ncbi:putative nucleic acid-binding protein [Rathayibacter iranicus NCPPB 2253 = VKM Ac-1602]|uniref:Nucleic acid-binding protein n=2 Tax=Rathayibacter iranicus TaxID=59737 RepID=A0ABX5LGY5_9MICO|nr:putative nucleic acid-binding protein [Rathayibacter iranicus NCPPB 2253 = VKM Ac-1602]